ncbi:MAG: hypothetical protein HUK22_00770 [Thermoguttaceae bacterium]|nr:hypothetical protein [Thermoguttaceae bacterium]
MTFNPNASNYGLTGGMVITTAQNYKNGAPASRVLNATSLKFDVGAYAAIPDVVPFEVVLSTTSPTYYDTVSASTTPAAAKTGATFQWYYVNSDGSETAISGATDAYFKVKDAAVGKALKVVVTGSGLYACKASATTKIVANPKITSVSLSRTAPVYNDTVSASVVPSLACATASFQWYRVAENGTETAIAGATNPYYKITSSADFGYKLKCVATGGGVFTGKSRRRRRTPSTPRRSFL